MFTVPLKKNAMKHVARKRFGQNFLHDKYVLSSITEAIAPQPDDAMVEIGPGLGAMTEQLMRTVKMMHVVGRDRDRVAGREKTYSAARRAVRAGEALKCDYASIPGPA